MKKAPAPEDPGEKVPIWIISFADMITLLLSFFVMLQTMASTRDATLFGCSQDSFRRALNGFGMPDLLFGKQTGPQRDYHGLKYPTEEAPDISPKNKVVDADDEQIRKIFDDLTRQMRTQTANRPENMIQAMTSPIHFATGSAQLDGPGQAYLTHFAAELKQNLDPQVAKVYIIGLAGEPMSPRQQWVLSAQRAQIGAEFLRKALAGKSGQCQWTINSWGNGSGNPYGSGSPATAPAAEQSPADRTAGSSSILIAVTGGNQSHGR